MVRFVPHMARFAPHTVGFAPHPARLLLVREAVPGAGGYLEGRLPAVSSSPEPVGNALGPVSAGPGTTAPDAPTPVPDPTQPAADDPAPTPDPFDDADALEELEDEIATLAAHIHAATHRLLTLIAEFDRRRGWELGGHRSCAHWLSFCTGIDLGAAREKVRTARALASLPLTGASMGRGELSFSKVRALTRVATGENEGELLELARGSTTAQLERMVRAFKLGSRKDEAQRERERYESRTFSVFPDEEGMYRVTGRLPAEVGALLMRAVEAAGDALYRENRKAGRLLERLQPEEESRKAAAQRRADALGLMAERALAVGFGEVRSAEGDEAGFDGEPGSEAGTGADAEAAREPAPAPTSGTRAERYQVVLHVEAETLNAQGEPGRSELEDGTRVAAETSRRLSCDAALVRITHAPNGSILDAGRRTRTIPPAIRRALEARDQGCRFPGCGLRFTEGHHLKHWADGGETKLENLLLLCRHHHRLVHEEGWKLDWWGEGRPVFYHPRGGMHFDGRWQWPKKGVSETPTENLAAALLEENRRRGVKPDGRTAAARWKRESDVPDRIYFGALEAMGESRP